MEIHPARKFTFPPRDADHVRNGYTVQFEFAFWRINMARDPNSWEWKVKDFVASHLQPNPNEWK